MRDMANESTSTVTVVPVLSEQYSRPRLSRSGRRDRHHDYQEGFLGEFLSFFRLTSAGYLSQRIPSPPPSAGTPKSFKRERIASGFFPSAGPEVMSERCAAVAKCPSLDTRRRYGLLHYAATPSSLLRQSGPRTVGRRASGHGAVPFLRRLRSIQGFQTRTIRRG